MRERPPEDKIVFAITRDEEGVPLLLVGISDECYKKMKSGTTNTVDLTKVKVPFRLCMFREDTVEKIIGIIEKHNEDAGLDTIKDFKTKFDIEPKKKPLGWNDDSGTA